MLWFPPGWRQSHGANVATAVSEALGARATHHERMWPQPAFSAILERFLAADPTFVVHDVGELHRAVTHEGEYGAQVVVRGRRGTTAALHVINAVFLGEFASALDLCALDPRQFAAIEALALDLLRGQRFELGRRPRQYFYQPPPGWHGLPTGLIATWFPREFPANRARIVIPPARPVDDLDGAIDELPAGLAIDHAARAPLRSRGGVDGIHVTVRGRRSSDDQPIHRELAGFVVDGWTYRFQLETALADRPTELAAVATSFEPLPRRGEIQIGQAFAARLDLFDHWAL